jgi:hypothetical protein
VNGEPVQGSMAQFIGMETRLLGARRVFIGHQDNWMPPVTPADFDVEPVRREIAGQAPDAVLTEVGYMEGTALA